MTPISLPIKFANRPLLLMKMQEMNCSPLSFITTMAEEHLSYHHTVCMCSLFPLSNQTTGFHKTRCERYAIGEQPDAAFSNFLHSVVTIWQTRELQR
jgi:hypothetical protein